MKKVLLATSALFLTAGVASAELVISGTAGAGIISAKTASGDIKDTNGDYQVYSGIDIDMAASTTADNGMTISAKTDIGAGFLADLADKEVNAQGGTLAAPEVKIGFNGVTIELESEGVQDYYDGDLHNYDIGVSGAFGGLTYGVALDTNDGEVDAATKQTSQYSATVGYTIAGVSLSASTNARDGLDAQTSMSASYTMGAIKATLKNDNMGGEGADAVNTITVAYTAGPAVITLSAKDDANNSWDASVVYTTGAYTISANTDESDAWEASVAYDLGGGATLSAGTDANETVVAGVSFAF
jgi:outer membrane protein OmpU